MRFRKRPRLVRLHLEGDRPSYEGVLLGLEAGHYRLANGRLLLDAERTFDQDGDSLDGQRFSETWVPFGHVLHLQVVG